MCARVVVTRARGYVFTCRNLPTSWLAGGEEEQGLLGAKEQGAEARGKGWGLGAGSTLPLFTGGNVFRSRMPPEPEYWRSGIRFSVEKKKFWFVKLVVYVQVGCLK